MSHYTEAGCRLAGVDNACITYTYGSNIKTTSQTSSGFCESSKTADSQQQGGGVSVSATRNYTTEGTRMEWQPNYSHTYDSRLKKKKLRLWFSFFPPFFFSIDLIPKKRTHALTQTHTHTHKRIYTRTDTRTYTHWIDNRKNTSSPTQTEVCVSQRRHCSDEVIRSIFASEELPGEGKSTYSEPVATNCRVRRYTNVRISTWKL